jgi:hypothetical protein
MSYVSMAGSLLQLGVFRILDQRIEDSARFLRHFDEEASSLSQTVTIGPHSAMTPSCLESKLFAKPRNSHSHSHSHLPLSPWSARRLSTD